VPAFELKVPDTHLAIRIHQWCPACVGVDEEGSWDLVVLEHIKDLLCGVRVWPIFKGERQHLQHIAYQSLEVKKARRRSGCGVDLYAGYQ
jgi:hypothetical protein